MCKKLLTLSLLFTILGALNWGIIAVSGVNVVEAIVGSGNSLAKIIYAVIGISALYSLFAFKLLGLCSCISLTHCKKNCTHDEAAEPQGCCGGKQHMADEMNSGCCSSHTAEKEAAGKCCKSK